MFNEAITNDPTVFAIPVFVALIIIEVVINAKKNLNLYKFKDSSANITMGLGSVVIGLLTKTFAFFVFLWIYQFRYLKFQIQGGCGVYFYWQMTLLFIGTID